MRAYPNGYYKNIFEIDYTYLKENNIKNIIFDVDNTLISCTDKKINNETYLLLKKLKNDFNVLLMSNNTNRKTKLIERELNIKCISLSMKPFKRNYNLIARKYPKDSCIFIGDNLSTDILGANRSGFKCILVDPIGKVSLYSHFYHLVELIVKDKKLKKGEYYKYE